MMNYRQLALLVSLAISLHGTCYATTVAGQADNEGAQNSVTLLHDSDGQTGQIVVSNSSGISVLTAPSQQISSISAFQPPPAPIIVSPSTIQSQYGDPVAPPSPAPSPQQPVPPTPTQFAPPTPVSPGSTNSPTKTGQGQTSLVSNNSGTVTAGLSTSQVLTGLSLGINAISPTSSTSTQTGGFSPLATFVSPPPPVAQSLAVQPLLLTTPSIENHLTDQILSAVTTQASQTPAAAAQYFFDQGKDAAEGTFGVIDESQYLVWGLWSVPLQKAPFTQSFGIIYSSDQLTTPSTLASLQQQQVTASYQGSLLGTVAYGNTATGIYVNDLAMSVNFGSRTLTFSGANGSLSGNGSFTAAAPTVTGSLSYNGTLNNNAPAALSGSFHGAFLGSAAEELAAAWAMTGKVNGTNATGAGILTVSQPS